MSLDLVWRRLCGPQADAQTLCDRAVLLAMFVLAALVMSKNSADPDLWGHWQYGLDAMRFGAFETATYTYTTPEQTWINHEWITEHLLAAGWQRWGAPGLLVAKWALGWLLLFVMYRRARAAGFAPFAAATWMLMIGVNFMLFWSLRPQVLSFLLLAVVLGLLDRAFGRDIATGSYREGWIRYRWLLPLPVIMALWSNVHGAFAAGLAVIGACLLIRAGQQIWRRRLDGWVDAVSLLSMWFLCIAATLWNPHGWRLHQWLWDSLSHPRPEILEWLPPEVFSVVWLPFWLWTAGCVAAVVVTRRRIDWAESFVLVALLWQAVSHHRHVPLFVMVSAWWLGDCWVECGRRIRRRREGASAPTPRPVLWLVTLGSVAASLFFAVTLWQRSQAIEVNSRWYPVDAFRFIHERGLGGRMVVQFKWAQYALAAFGDHNDPDATVGTTVAFDGRFRTCYPQWVVDMYFDFAKGIGPAVARYRGADSPAFDPARILSLGQPDLVLIDRNVKPATDTLRRHAREWVLLYEDNVAELWGRRNRYDVPHSPHFLPREQRVVRGYSVPRPVSFPAFP